MPSPGNVPTRVSGPAALDILYNLLSPWPVDKYKSPAALNASPVMLKPDGVDVVGAMICVAVMLATALVVTGALILYRPYLVALEQSIHKLPLPSKAISPEL